MNGRKAAHRLVKRQTSDPQARAGVVVGYECYEELTGEPFSDAILDSLLSREELIPESWKQDSGDSTFCFWGALEGIGGGRYARTLYGGWHYDWPITT